MKTKIVNKSSRDIPQELVDTTAKNFDAVANVAAEYNLRILEYHRELSKGVITEETYVFGNR